MPWKEQTVSEMRRAFVTEVKEGMATKTALCARYGISRPTGDKWIERYDKGESMEDRSRRPAHIPKQTEPEMEAAILRLRQEHPTLGARKIKRILENRGQSPPGHSTVHAVLKRNGCVSEEASQASRPYQRFERSAPNELWQMDFKGCFSLGNGKECHPLNILDDHSRYCMQLDAKANEQLEGTWTTVQNAMRTYGLPEAILCDNGNPWGSKFCRGYTQFERMLLDQDIRPIHGRPYHPQTQGKDERFNQTLKRECLQGKEIADLMDAQQRFELFRKFYNEERPHHALGLAVPASRYKDSKRLYLETIPAFVYPEGLVVRKVHDGHVKYLGARHFITTGFNGTELALQPLQDSDQDGIVEVLYRNWQVALIDLRTGEVTCRLRRVTRLDS